MNMISLSRRLVVASAATGLVLSGATGVASAQSGDSSSGTLSADGLGGGSSAGDSSTTSGSGSESAGGDSSSPTASLSGSIARGGTEAALGSAQGSLEALLDSELAPVLLLGGSVAAGVAFAPQIREALVAAGVVPPLP